MKARCREILARGPHLVQGDDYTFLLTEVFPRHPEWSEKQASGVRNIEVRISGMYRSVGFWLIRSDGSEIDISYRTSIDGRGTERARATNAARSEITAQIGVWKAANPMPLPGMHCDHVDPFDAIFNEWLGGVGLANGEITVISNRVGHQDLFLSRDLALSWQRFHKQRARYQWLAASENIAKSNKTGDAINGVEETRYRRAA